MADLASQIERYASGTAAVLAAAEAVGARLDHAPTGEWTPRQVIHHLADAETRSALRLRQLVAEDTPRIEAYDEGAWARRLHYDRPVEASLEVIGAVRAASLELLRSLTHAELARTGTHPEHGRYGIDTWLQIYADHAHDHAEQMRAAALRDGVSEG